MTVKSSLILPQNSACQEAYQPPPCAKEWSPTLTPCQKIRKKDWISTPARC